MHKVMRWPVWMPLFIIILLIDIFFISYALTFLDDEEKSISVKDVRTSPSNKQLDTVILNEATVAQFLKSDDNTNIFFKDHRIIISSESSFLTKKIKTKVITKPQALNNGNLSLTIQEIEIGDLPLNSKNKLHLIERFAELPDGVKIERDKNRFVYDMSQLKMGKTNMMLSYIDPVTHRWHFHIEVKE